MTTIVIVQVSLQLFCAFVLLFPIVGLCIRKNKTTEKAQSLLVLACMICLLLILDSMAYIFRGKMSALAHYMVRISNFGVFYLEYVSQLALVLYLSALIEENGGKPNPIFQKAVRFLVGFGIGLLILTQITGTIYSINASNLYSRGPWFPVFYIVHLSIFLFEIILIFQHRKDIGKWNTVIVGSYFAVTIGFSLMQYALYGLSLVNIGITFTVMVMVVRDTLDLNNENVRQMQLLVEQQKNSEELRRRILLSSIQPHFLFNSLNAIEGLITIDPDQALGAVEDLSQFLRASVDSLNSDDSVSIFREIKTLKNYLSLIQLRFWGNIEVEWDIPECINDYFLPAFTLQPLAENAINHGIRKTKMGRGKLIVRCRDEEDSHVIFVIDDGVGFQVDDISDENGTADGHVHMGIKIVRDRLKLMCDGSLEITSEPGKGTTCEIRIPIRR